jgi:hypothetical protein
MLASLSFAFTSLSDASTVLTPEEQRQVAPGRTRLRSS